MMEMTEHTKEPWEASQRSIAGTVDVYVGDGVNGNIERIADVIGVENARRIVACVNACAGISTEELELVENIEFPNPTYSELKKQRDELLEIVKAVQEGLEFTPEFCKRIDDVIAICESAKWSIAA